jgi:sugar phosphate isomerase/epimerase
MPIKRQLVSLAFLAGCLAAHAQFDTARRTGGFRLGVQAWSFTRFTTMEAIQKVSEAGGTNIELFPGQRLGKDYPGVVIGPDMDAASMSVLRNQLSKYSVNVVAYGVAGIDTDENSARKLFAWAKSLGIGIINTESTGSIDTIDKMVKEFDMRVGFHDHPRTSDPKYRMWDPNYILEVVRNHDRRIGSCADTGHWVRSGIKPVEALRILKGRVMSCHLKDLNQFSPDGHDVPYGGGVSDVPDILRELRRQGFAGTVSVEYEYNMDNSLTEVAECLAYVRGFIDGSVGRLN